MKDKASAPASVNNLAISPERRFTVEEVAKAIAAEAIGKGGYRGSEAEAQFAAYVKKTLPKLILLPWKRWLRAWRGSRRR
jgi:hypothetical protein